MFNISLSLDNCSEKTKVKKPFEYLHILHCIGFLMISITTHYDENIDRANLTEQKNLFDYIDPPPTKMDPNNKYVYT